MAYTWLIALAALTTGGPAAAADTFPRGRIVDRVVTLSDSTESYALYLPSDYPGDRRWPVLLLMDPRGRASIPMELYVEAAERLGYLILSSYGTRSDGPAEPNEKAVRAMLGDVERRWSADVTRLYLVGFSGTSRISWLFANNLRGHVAGVIGFGAGLPSGRFAQQFQPAADERPFSFFGGSGHHDFNYEEMRNLEPQLGQAAIAHRIQFWEGGHGWPPARVAAASVEWMEVEAMRTGLVPVDSAWLRERFGAEVDAAEALETEGRFVDAVRRYQAITRSFGSLLDIGALGPRIQRIADSRDAQRQAERADRLGAEQREHEARIYELIEEMGEGKDLDAERAAGRLRVEELLERAEDDGDPVSRDAAQRVLEIMYVHLSFYQPLQWLDAGKTEAALVSLAVAERIKGPGVRLCYQRALVFAVTGELDRAIEQVECALEGAPFLVEQLAAEAHLAPLADDPRYRKSLEAARARVRTP